MEEVSPRLLGFAIESSQNDQNETNILQTTSQYDQSFQRDREHVVARLKPIHPAWSQKMLDIMNRYQECALSEGSGLPSKIAMSFRPSFELSLCHQDIIATQAPNPGEDGSRATDGTVELIAHLLRGPHAMDVALPSEIHFFAPRRDAAGGRGSIFTVLRLQQQLREDDSQRTSYPAADVNPHTKGISLLYNVGRRHWVHIYLEVVVNNREVKVTLHDSARDTSQQPNEQGQFPAKGLKAVTQEMPLLVELLCQNPALTHFHGAKCTEVIDGPCLQQAYDTDGAFLAYHCAREASRGSVMHWGTDVNGDIALKRRLEVITAVHTVLRVSPLPINTSSQHHDNPDSLTGANQSPLAANAGSMEASKDIPASFDQEDQARGELVARAKSVGALINPPAPPQGLGIWSWLQEGVDQVEAAKQGLENPEAVTQARFRGTLSLEPLALPAVVWYPQKEFLNPRRQPYGSGEWKYLLPEDEDPSMDAKSAWRFQTKNSFEHRNNVVWVPEPGDQLPGRFDSGSKDGYGVGVAEPDGSEDTRGFLSPLTSAQKKKMESSEVRRAARGWPKLTAAEERLLVSLKLGHGEKRRGPTFKQIAQKMGLDERQVKDVWDIVKPDATNGGGGSKRVMKYQPARAPELRLSRGQSALFVELQAPAQSNGTRFPRFDELGTSSHFGDMATTLLDWRLAQGLVADIGHGMQRMVGFDVTFGLSFNDAASRAHDAQGKIRCDGGFGVEGLQWYVDEMWDAAHAAEYRQQTPFERAKLASVAVGYLWQSRLKMAMPLLIRLAEGDVEDQEFTATFDMDSRHLSPVGRRLGPLLVIALPNHTIFADCGDVAKNLEQCQTGGKCISMSSPVDSGLVRVVWSFAAPFNNLSPWLESRAIVADDSLGRTVRRKIKEIYNGQGRPNVGKAMWGDAFDAIFDGQ